MVNKTLTRKKLNNEKGVTGVDIVVSVTMIVVTIAVVMAIFANISSVSRDINRTSGATRIATNILENIEIMYYEDFLTELQKLQTETGYVNFVATDANYNGTYTINGKAATGKKIFKTTIPTGYTLKLDVENVYGNTSTDKYDLVRSVKVSVIYSVSGREEDVTLATTKVFEKIDSIYNEPVLEANNFKELVIEAGKTFDEIKTKMKYVEEIQVAGGTTKYKLFTNMPNDVYKYDTPSEIIPVMIYKLPEDLTFVEGMEVEESVLKLENLYVWIPSHRIHGSDIIYEYETYEVARTVVSKTNAAGGHPLGLTTVNSNIEVKGGDIGFKYLSGTNEVRVTGFWYPVDKLNILNNYEALDPSNPVLTLLINENKFWKDCVKSDLK